jgi:predicted DNA-binding mobile mystery protein A
MANHPLALKQIESRFKDFESSLFKAEQGWIRQMRQALGMTLSKLAEACGSSTPSIAQAERREAEGKVSVETLKSAAEAMNCEFVYMFVPKSEMTSFVERKAYEKAKRLIVNADLHMSLEDQKVKGDLEPRIQRLKKKLIDEGKVW